MSPESIPATDLAVIQCLFSAIPEEMGVVLGRSAFSANIKERRDFSCALFDKQGQLLAQAAHIPVHLGAMPRSVEAVLEDFPDLKPGEMVMLNDPFRGGSHLPDITLVSPLATEPGGEVSGYAATRAHHADVGGMTAGSLPDSTSIYQEGLRIPPVRIMKNGDIDEDLLRIFCANSRNPDERKGDLRAQFQSHQVAEKRWQSLLQKKGAHTLDSMTEALLRYGERRMRSLLSSLPDGQWDFEDQLENADAEKDFTGIRARLSCKQGEIQLDFRESDDAVTGSLNAVHAICESAVYYGFLCLLGSEYPGETLPVNAGTFRPLKCITRCGSVLNAGWPHAVAGGNVETSQRIVDVVFGLLGEILPGRIPAQSQGTMNNITMGGSDSDGKSFSAYETLGGGCGATAKQRGADAVQVHMTNTLNTPVEALEFGGPVLLREYAIRDGSGGGGKYRGGHGLIREWEMLETMEVTLLTERRVLSPQGAGRGSPGKVGIQFKLSLSGERIPLESKGSWIFKRGERLRIETPGGGGYGEPVS